MATSNFLEQERIVAERIWANDMRSWYPLLVAAGLRTPKTRIVTTGAELIRIIDGESPPGFDVFAAALKVAAQTIGYPCFLRTGQGSGKHFWRNTCFVASEAVILQHVVELVEWSECQSLQGLPTSTWAVRKLLDLDAPFLAYHGMPVATEARVFINKGTVQCWHPYWPEDAVEQGKPEGEWREALKQSYELINKEQEAFLVPARRLAEFFGHWSVDFARTKTGDWYALDMAMAVTSFHWPACAHNMLD